MLSSLLLFSSHLPLSSFLHFVHLFGMSLYLGGDVNWKFSIFLFCSWSTCPHNGCRTIIVLCATLPFQAFSILPMPFVQQSIHAVFPCILFPLNLLLSPVKKSVFNIIVISSQSQAFVGRHTATYFANAKSLLISSPKLRWHFSGSVFSGLEDKSA